MGHGISALVTKQPRHASNVRLSELRHDLDLSVNSLTGHGCNSNPSFRIYCPLFVENKADCKSSTHRFGVGYTVAFPYGASFEAIH